MLNIYLARHGQDEDNAKGILNGRRDQSLTPLGVNQAKELAQRIKSLGIKFEKTYSSPLIRAYQTAKTITDILGMAIPETLDLLVERDFGEMTGESIENIKAKCAPDILENENVTYFLCAKEAETFPQLIERADKLLTWLNDRYQIGNLLLVCHGDIGKMIYACYYHLEWQEVLRTFHFANADLLLLSPNSPANEPYVLQQKR